jgi:hypothetical protein
VDFGLNLRNTRPPTPFRAHVKMQDISWIHQHIIIEGGGVCLINSGRQRLGNVEQIVTADFITTETKPLYSRLSTTYIQITCSVD